MPQMTALTALGRCAAAAALLLVLPAAVEAAPAARFGPFLYAGADVDPGALPHSPSQYRNPVLQGFYPDPGLLRVGSDYYLANSTFSYFPGIPIWHSSDLVHWTQIGNAIDRPSQVPFAGTNTGTGVYAPDISFHDGLYRIANFCNACGGIFIITATNPAGPWSNAHFIATGGGYDPSLFFDDDGRAYLVWTAGSTQPPAYTGHQALYLQQIDLNTFALTGPRTVLVDAGFQPETEPAYAEGPHIFKRDGYYYLNFAQGGTDVGHTQVIFRSQTLVGPYVSSPTNPILTQKDLDPSRPFPITSTGHADFVQTQNGEWWATFLGVRPYEADDFNTGRETFLLPVTWSNDWPTILPPQTPVPYLVSKPNLLASSAALPTSGSFIVTDNFRERNLPPYWIAERAPTSSWWSVGDGYLDIAARNQSIGDPTAQPSLLARRQQHLYATVSTAVSFAPTGPGDRAGLAAYQNESHYYVLAVSQQNGKSVIELQKRAATTDPTDGMTVATAPLPVGSSRATAEPVFLRIDARGARYDFFYAIHPGKWIPLASNQDGTVLATNTAGGFTGAVFGLYAYSSTN